MFNTILVANRGVIASRIIRTLSRMGIRSIAVYHDDDFQADYVARASHSVGLGDGGREERPERLQRWARRQGEYR